MGLGPLRHQKIENKVEEHLSIGDINDPGLEMAPVTPMHIQLAKTVLCDHT